MGEFAIRPLTRHSGLRHHTHEIPPSVYPLYSHEEREEVTSKSKLFYYVQPSRMNVRSAPAPGMWRLNSKDRRLATSLTVQIDSRIVSNIPSTDHRQRNVVMHLGCTYLYCLLIGEMAKKRYNSSNRCRAGCPNNRHSSRLVQNGLL